MKKLLLISGVLLFPALSHAASPTITDPQAVRFANEELRPACDRLISAIRTLRQMAANYSSYQIGSQVAGTTPLQNSYIADGSMNAEGNKIDGRTPLLGYDIDNAIGKANALLGYIDSQAGMESALTKPAVNDAPLY